MIRKVLREIKRTHSEGKEMSKEHRRRRAEAERCYDEISERMKRRRGE